MLLKMAELARRWQKIAFSQWDKCWLCEVDNSKYAIFMRPNEFQHFFYYRKNITIQNGSM